MSRLRFVLAFGVMVLSTTPALAQPASDGDRAITAGHDALDLYNKGSWAPARTRFEEADRLMHSPVFLLYAARCARNAGDLAAAKGLYERVAAETLPAGAPPPWASAVTSAKVELAEVTKRLAEAVPTATVSAGPTAPPVVTSAPLPTSTGVATGAPAVSATAAIAPSAAPSASATTAPTGSITPSPATGSLVPGIVTLGIGLAGLGASIGTFAHAKSIANGILERCGDNPTCSDDELPNRKAAYDFAAASTGAFIGGTVLAAAGVALLIWRPFGRPSPAGQVVVQPGIGALRVTGSF